MYIIYIDIYCVHITYYLNIHILVNSVVYNIQGGNGCNCVYIDIQLNKIFIKVLIFNSAF